ncbi:hypothetical protein ACS0TY_014670 [Phlomoides rotata]
MKLLSYNVRGLGSRAKCREIREMIKGQGVDFCCVQETKKENIDEMFCKRVWGEGNIGWAFREAEGRSGGILSIWNADKFSVMSCWHTRGAVVVNGMWGSERSHCCIINVYAPCPLTERKLLWEMIETIVSQNITSCICVIGDFNSIRRESERRGICIVSGMRDMEIFDGFMRNTGLLYMQLHGRSFTWYKADGTCKSRIDRAMINSEWVSKWPNSYLKGLRRTLSDHCPIMLEIKVKDWGPKPFRSLNAWFSFPGFKEYVAERWNSYEIDGWGGYVLKEKLKRLKDDLKQWNKEVFGTMERKIEEYKVEIQIWIPVMRMVD